MDHDTTQLDKAFARLLAEHERFMPSLQCEGGEALDAALLGTREVMDAAIAECKAMFNLSEDRHAAHLWLYTFLGDVAAPSVMLMVTSDEIPNLDLTQGTLAYREGRFWFAFRPRTQAASVQDAGAGLAASLRPMVEGLCEHFGLRPAPLWAVIADGVVQPAVAAGNEEFETAKAWGIAYHLHAGIQQAAGVKVPPLRVDAVEGDALLPLDAACGEAAVEDEPEYLLAHRSSCCMILHSPNAGKCTSCPKQPRDIRVAGQLAAARGY